MNAESKIIYDRTPRERVQKAAPWLKVDGDIYPAVVDGRIVWIVDGYTTSNSYPYSQRVTLDEVTSDAQTSAGGTVVPQPGRQINYMRNSVKAVVDAYDGTVKLYAWDDTDPVLQTWRKAFPGVVKDKAEISADLLEHLRYPQDMFKVQRQILARYHITDPGNWYQNSDLWEVPNDPVPDAPARRQGVAVLPVGEVARGRRGAVLADHAYVPDGRQNLAAYMAVNADASSPDYGRMRILQMSARPRSTGPGRRSNVLNSNEAVAERLRPFLSQGTASATFGNLLTLPVGGGLLYVQPVYTQRQGSTGGLSGAALRAGAVRLSRSASVTPCRTRWTRCSRATPACQTEEEGGGKEPPTRWREPGQPGRQQGPGRGFGGLRGRRSGAEEG